MKLIIDIGNSAAKLVCFDKAKPQEELKTSNETLDGLWDFVKKYPFDRGIVGTVCNLSDKQWDALRKLPFPILEFCPQTPIPICNKYKTPETLGSDRLAAAIGAFTLQPGKDSLIIDAGTCITYDVIDAQGNYWGGNIAPGMHMRLKALHEFTSRLPLVSPDGDVPGMGYNTETAIRSGILRGMKYEIEGYIRSMKRKYPKLQVYLTGGDEINFDNAIKTFVHTDKFIVPRGLNKILDYNYGRQ